MSTVSIDDVDPEDMPEAYLGITYELNMNQYVAADDDLESSEPLTDDTIISLVQQAQQKSGSDSDYEDDDAPLDPPTHLEAIEMVIKLRQYFEFQSDSTKFFVYLNSLEKNIRRAQQKALQQTSITQFM